MSRRRSRPLTAEHLEQRNVPNGRSKPASGGKCPKVRAKELTVKTTKQCKLTRLNLESLEARIAPVTDMAYALGLVPVEQATAVVIRDGLWSAPSTWLGGKVPIAGDKVYDPTGLSLTLDVQTPKLSWLRIDGNFNVKPDAVTKLWSETDVSSAGHELAFTNQAPSHQLGAGCGVQCPEVGEDHLERTSDRS